MYAVRLRVDPNATQADGLETKAVQDITAGLLTESSRADADPESTLIPISAGNPRVEHLTGIVSLYKRVPSRSEIESGAWKAEEVCFLGLNLTFAWEVILNIQQLFLRGCL